MSQKNIVLFAVLLSCIAVLSFSQTTFAVRNTAGWVDAVNGIRNGGNDKEYVITVTGTVSVPATGEGNTFGSVTGVTITIEGNGTLSPSANGNLLRIGDKQTVVTKDLTLKGRNGNNASVVEIAEGGTFRMEGKAQVTGNTSSSDGGGVYVDGGTFTMSGGTISGNTAKSGGGVSVRNGTFTMEGGSISGNTAKRDDGGSSGGGVSVGGTFTMKGGTISGNTSTYRGGGVDVWGTFTMKDGTISGNTARGDGGGVFVFWGGTFTMEGGSISGNTAAYSGGGVDVSYNGTFTMENGTISGNTASDGGGVSVESATFFTMKDGTISGNTAIYFGGGVLVHSKGTFTMQGNASVSGNKASVQGGGVYVGWEGTFTKIGGTIYGGDANQSLKNTTISGIGHAMYEEKSKGWRNASAGPTMNTDSYGFWLNEGDLVMFPSGFAGVWKRNNFINMLTITENAMASSYVWVLQKISGNAYTLKRADASNTMTLTIRLVNGNLEISGDSGSGANNWNGTWRKR